MTAQTIINLFTANLDKGNEYKLRFTKSQAGNQRFSEQMCALFVTEKTKNGAGATHQRNDAAVKAALDNDAYTAAWRKKYGCLPLDSLDIVKRWLRAQLDNDNIAAAACIVFAARSTVKTVPKIEQFCGLTCACWVTTEKCQKPRIVPLLFDLTTAV